MTYNQFIESCKQKHPKKPYHKHHIIPLSVGGPDTRENKIKLSFEDHYEAHKLLAEENPSNEIIVKDFNRLGTLEQFINRSTRCYEAASNPTDEVRAKLATNKGKHLVFSEEHKRHISEAAKGRKMSEETKQKISDKLKGKTSPMKGVVHDEEYKRRMSESCKGNHWFTNGIDSVFTRTCPEGYRPGRLLKRS